MKESKISQTYFYENQFLTTTKKDIYYDLFVFRRIICF